MQSAMIPQRLSNTVRIFSVFNASTTSVLPALSAAYSNQFQRERLSPKIRKTVEKIMGTKPKQPLPPYFRFIQQIRPQVVAEHPGLLQQKDLQKIFSEKWKSLEAKEKEIFSEDYRNDMQKYLEEISNYNKTMTVTDKRLATVELEKDDDSDLIKLSRRLARQLNKPKKPPCSFLRFLHAQSDRRSDETHKEFVKRTSTRWNALSKTERKKYETTPKEVKDYKKAMLEWEANVKRSVMAGSGDLFFLKFNENEDGQLQENVDEDEVEDTNL